MPASIHDHRPPPLHNPLVTTWTSTQMLGLETAATRMDDLDSAKRAAEIHHEDLADATERTHKYSKNLMYNTQITTERDMRFSSKT